MSEDKNKFLELKFSELDDLRNRVIILENQINSVDTIVRKFPQNYPTEYVVLKSNEVSTYNDSEYVILDQAYESGNQNASLPYTQVYGTTDWTKSHIKLRYQKYKSGKVEGHISALFTGSTSGIPYNGETHYWWQICISMSQLIKNLDGNIIPSIISESWSSSGYPSYFNSNGLYVRTAARNSPPSTTNLSLELEFIAYYNLSE